MAAQPGDESLMRIAQNVFESQLTTAVNQLIAGPLARLQGTRLKAPPRLAVEIVNTGELIFEFMKNYNSGQLKLFQINFKNSWSTLAWIGNKEKEGTRVYRIGSLQALPMRKDACKAYLIKEYLTSCGVEFTQNEYITSYGFKNLYMGKPIQPPPMIIIPQAVPAQIAKAPLGTQLQVAAAAQAERDARMELERAAAAGGGGGGAAPARPNVRT